MYADVILPVPPTGVFTYLVPPEWEALVVSGSLVSAPFGKERTLSGIVHRTMDTSPLDPQLIRPLTALLSAEPMVLPEQLRFWEWMSQYYFCTLGDVSRQVLPAIIRSKEKPPGKPRLRKTKTAEIQPLQPLHRLSPAQAEASAQIQSVFSAKDVCLLHGVTASGKTEIYTHLIGEAIARGQQTLYLLPEIALTAQMTGRLKRFFGDRLAVFHSGIGEGERVRIWNHLLNGDTYDVVLGARSALFLPFRRLGLLIVDEEHEPSYKQQEPAPRYHARDAAIVLAAHHGAKVLLGSATPSIETFHNAQGGKYGYVSLVQRFESAGLPAILPVDVKDLRRRKLMKSIFSPLLIEHIQATLARGGQILLFQNRRGFAPGMVCKACDQTPKCRYCDVSLTYHKQLRSLTCHYCGRNYALPPVCPSCGGHEWNFSGYGTEKVEEEIQALFPGIAAARLDTDQSRRQVENLLLGFAAGDIRILIGTQMISKGLHFDNVQLAAILSADALMNFPDFRAYERAYQLMSQVAGRAGRGQTPGEVILQTSDPSHPLIQAVLQQDYATLYALQTEERALFRYPPFYRLIAITLRHRNEATLNRLAAEYAALLREKLGDRIVGPDKPAVGKIRNLFLRKIMIKIERSASSTAIRALLKQVHAQAGADFRYAVVVYDADPV
jgi:primosomal protein N' (replication factor Y)